MTSITVRFHPADGSMGIARDFRALHTAARWARRVAGTDCPFVDAYGAAILAHGRMTVSGVTVYLGRGQRVEVAHLFPTTVEARDTRRAGGAE